MSAHLAKLACFMLPAWLILLTTFALPEADLSGWVGLAAYAAAESGGKLGTPLVAIACLALLATRPGLDRERRIAEVGGAVLVLAVILGGIAYVNEHVIKPGVAAPRPNIRELASNRVLGMSAKAFYALGDKDTRSEHLRSVLTVESSGPSLLPEIREHWIVETGYSFPSGHSQASMLLATFLFGLGLAWLEGWRRWVFYLLPVWALAVRFSRPLLRVHTPTDVSVGGLTGIVLGSVAFALLWSAIERQRAQAARRFAGGYAVDGPGGATAWTSMCG